MDGQISPYQLSNCGKWMFGVSGACVGLEFSDGEGTEGTEGGCGT